MHVSLFQSSCLFPTSSPVPVALIYSKNDDRKKLDHQSSEIPPRFNAQNAIADHYADGVFLGLTETIIRTCYS